jgi:DSBA-like thioredoxin domain
VMILADGLIVQCVAVSVAVSLLIKHIDHVAAMAHCTTCCCSISKSCGPVHLVRYAADLGLDVDLFREDLRRHVGAESIADDVDSAGSSGVAGTPTFFIKGRRQYGAYGIDTLTAAAKTAKAQAKLNLPSSPGMIKSRLMESMLRRGSDSCILAADLAG